MASVINLYDDAGNPFPIDGEMLKKALPTAWVNFDGSGANGVNCTIRDSYNVSSVYKVSTGEYTVYFNSAMANSNYTLSGTGTLGNGAIQSIEMASNATPKSTTSIQVIGVATAAGGLTDLILADVIIHGGKD